MNTFFTKAYNETWIENIHNQSVIENWHFRGLMDKIQMEAAKNEFPVGFKQKNIFVTIGLFIFANIIIFAVVGFISIFFASVFNESYSFGVLGLIYGIILLVFSENFIKKNNFYRSGIDNALIYNAIAAFFVFVLAITDFKLPFWVYTLALSIILFVALLKYADLLVTVCFYAACLVLLFNILGKYEIGKMLLPFVMMISSASFYFYVKNLQKKAINHYYSDALAILETLALATFYLGGNYFIVREGNAVLNNLPDSIQIPFFPIFYFFTIGIPLFYIFWALKKHDRKMLIVGLLAFAFSIFTYKIYFSVLPLEWALTIGGLVLSLGSVLVIRQLNETKLGLNYKADGENKYQNFEAIIVNKAMPTANTPDGTKFGGGDFGGGGAGESY
jgi:hypothetical protein